MFRKPEPEGRSLIGWVHPETWHRQLLVWKASQVPSAHLGRMQWGLNEFSRIESLGTGQLRTGPLVVPDFAIKRAIRPVSAVEESSVRTIAIPQPSFASASLKRRRPSSITIVRACTLWHNFLSTIGYRFANWATTQTWLSSEAEHINMCKYNCMRILAQILYSQSGPHSSKAVVFAINQFGLCITYPAVRFAACNLIGYLLYL